MSLYVKLAWRNLLRNRRRSLIAGTAIGVGLASLIFSDALVIGMERNMVASATSTFLGQGEIHRSGFRLTQQADLTIDHLDYVVANLARETSVRCFTLRALSFAMVSSSADVSSIELVGIDPATEREMSEIDNAIVDGNYFSGNNARDIVIGSKLAERLSVRVGDRIVVTVSQVRSGALSQELFLVSGIYRLGIPEMDRGMAFISLPVAQTMLGIGAQVHEIALLFTDPKYGSDAQLPFWAKYSRFGNEAVGWPTLLPQVEAAFAISRFSIYLVGLILFALVALGIVNTLFMSLHERMFEFGVLLAVGTRPAAIARMIVYEAGALAVVSCVLGSILGLLVTLILSHVGINYTGIEFVGVTIRKLLYPVLDVRQFIEYPFWVFIFTALTGMYPALYAARLNPSRAMRRSL